VVVSPFLSLFSWAYWPTSFIRKGGAVQEVVRRKTNTEDIRSATFVDLIYGVILYIFKYDYFGLWGAKIPMSTTWVFIGLLAGRELAIRLNLERKITGAVGKMILSDFVKVFLGLVVSVVLVFVIKLLAG
jgi:phosphate/sulfate permease